MSEAAARPLVPQRTAGPSLIAVLVAAAALVGGNAAGRTGLAVAVIAVQVLFTLGWLSRFSMPVDAYVIAVAGAAVTDLVLLRTRSAAAGSIAGVLGLSVIAVLFHQIVRRGARGVTETVAVTLSVVTLNAALAILLPLRELPGGRSMVFAGLVSAGAGLSVVRVLRGPDLLRRLLALAAAVLVGLWCEARPSGILTSADGVYLGLATGFAVLLVDRVTTRMSDQSAASRAPHAGLHAWALAGCIPLMLSPPIAYAVGRAITSGSFAYVAGQVIAPGGG